MARQSPCGTPLAKVARELKDSIVTVNVPDSGAGGSRRRHTEVGKHEAPKPSRMGTGTGRTRRPGRARARHASCRIAHPLPSGPLGHQLPIRHVGRNGARARFAGPPRLRFGRAGGPRVEAAAQEVVTGVVTGHQGLLGGVAMTMRMSGFRRAMPDGRGGLPRYGRWIALAILLLVTSIATVRDAGGAIIFVTTLEQKIGGPGCSLQEAVYSANFALNVAIAGYGSPLNFSDHAPRVVATDCVPGHGDDIIVLPSGALFQLSKIVDDADNPIGPTATPMITSNITIEANGATLQYVPTVTEVCDIFINVPCTPASLRAFAVGPTGHLTTRNAYIKVFRAQDGFGSDGGGGLGVRAGR